MTRPGAAVRDPFPDPAVDWAPVSESTDSATPSKPSRPPRERRSRKFVLPEHHRDETLDDRTSEHIEAFLDGPEASPRRRATDVKRSHRPIDLDTRPDWLTALRYEEARRLRYGRPTSVLLVELRERPNPAMVDAVARRLVEVIRAQARETDRAVRLTAMSFRVLLPETGGRAARRLAERVDRAFLDASNGSAEPGSLCIEIASPGRTGTLAGSIAEAEARLATRATSR